MTLELLKWISCRDFILCFALSIKKYKVRTRGNHLKSIYFHVQRHHPPESHNLVANFKTLISRPHLSRGLLPTSFNIFYFNIEPVFRPLCLNYTSTANKAKRLRYRLTVRSYLYYNLSYMYIALYTHQTPCSRSFNNFEILHQLHLRWNQNQSRTLIN